MAQGDFTKTVYVNDSTPYVTADTLNNTEDKVKELDTDIGAKALKSNVLEKDNTTSFTPDADYEPATKKYVDDNAGGGNISKQIFIAGGTFTAPKAGTYKITVVGGGGAGGGGNNSEYSGGGGAGGLAIKYATLTNGETVTVTVGSAGSTSSFGTYASATGGSAGANGDDATVYSGTGGAGGTATGGDINVPGETGWYSSSACSGRGAHSMFGTGGQVLPRNNESDGNSATGYGAGGGGSFSDDSSYHAGGAGVAGIVIVEYV